MHGDRRTHGRDDEAQRALAQLDSSRLLRYHHALVALGAHPYLVFMARLRLDMVRTPGTFEHF